jgi:hypothetical protein
MDKNLFFTGFDFIIISAKGFIINFILYFYLIIIIIQSSKSIGTITKSIFFSSKYSYNPVIFSLNFITSSIIITQFFSTFSQIRAKKSFVLLFIQSIKTKS